MRYFIYKTSRLPPPTGGLAPRLASLPPYGGALGGMSSIPGKTSDAFEHDE